MRVMAIQMEDKLFDEFKTLVEESGMSLKAYVTNIIGRELDSHKQVQEETFEEAAGPVKWELEEVVKALDDFILQNNRVPTQKEFRNENGLPSYNAAKRCLEQLPSEYCQKRLDEMQLTEETPEQNEGMTMGI